MRSTGWRSTIIFFFVEKLYPDATFFDRLTFYAVYVGPASEADSFCVKIALIGARGNDLAGSGSRTVVYEGRANAAAAAFTDFNHCFGLVGKPFLNVLVSFSHSAQQGSSLRWQVASHARKFGESDIT